MHRIISFLYFAIIFFTLFSCSSQSDKGMSQHPDRDKHSEQRLVINELMSSNRTGILTQEGKPADWIEIKNISTDDIQMKDYMLWAEKEEKNRKDKKEGKADSLATKPWVFPELTLQPGQCILIFASKKKGDATSTELHANLKLPKKGSVRLLSPKGTILSEIQYTALNADQALQRLENGDVIPTYQPTPGFDNTSDGYEAYCSLIEKQRKSPLRIWELCSKASYPAPNWVKLRNVSTDTISLKDYCLTDKPGKPGKWQFADTRLLPGQTCTVQFVGKQTRKRKTEERLPDALEVNFKLNDDECLLLTRAGKFADGLCAKPTLYGTTIGRCEDRDGFFFHETDSNSNAYRYVAQTPAFEQQPGSFGEGKSMCITINTHGRPIHYTLNGSEPDMNSPLYKDSIRIDSTTTIRIMAEGDTNTLHSPIATATYFMGIKHNLPIVNIAVSNDDLFSQSRGIYARGPRASAAFPYMGANFWKKWERKAHVAFYDGDKGFESDCGIRIFGGYSRGLDKKSFRIQFRQCYGNSNLTYDCYNQGKPMKQKSFILRTGAQDDFHTNVSDEFFTSLMAAECPSLLTQAYRPVVVYINGSYFGVYFMREKFNEHFVARHLNVSPDSTINVIFSSYCEKGSMAGFNALRNYANSHDMTQNENYEYMAQHLDCQGLIDLTIGQVYAGNTDVGNIRHVLSTDPAGDQKWHWVFYDLDSSWLGYTGTSYYLHENPDRCMQSVFFNRLAHNKLFRKLCLERLSHHLHHTFTLQNATRVFDGIISTIKPEMKRNFDRWPQLTYEQWERNVARFREKFEKRGSMLYNDFKNELRITAEEEKQYFSNLGF